MGEGVGFLKSFEKLGTTAEQRAAMLGEYNWSELLGLEPEDLKILAGYLVPYRGKRGAAVFHKGEHESFMCLICSGEVQVCRGEGWNISQILSTLGPETTVGEMALIDGEPRSASAYATQDTVLYVMTRSSFQRLAEEHPTVWGKLLLRIARQLSQRLRKSNDVNQQHHL